MTERGEQGRRGAEGATGARGAEGAEGARGAEGIGGTEGARGRQGVPGERGLRGQQPFVTRLQMLAIFLITVIAFTVVGFRTEIQQRQINRNAAKLAQVVYAQCVTQDQTAARQAVLIDSAIAAERRKPKPDAKRIADLDRFRPDRLNCGTKPSN